VKTVGKAFGLTAVTAAVLAVSAVALAGPAKEQGLLKRPVHADIDAIKANGAAVQVTLDRGRVTASSPASITLMRPDGVSVTLAVAQTTKVRGVVSVGARALVLSRGGTASLILTRGARTLPKLARLKGVVHADVDLIKADGSTDSFTLDRGAVTAETSSSVTLKRKDDQSVTLAVDSNTKVRKQGKPATVSALAVGDRGMFLSRNGTAFLIRVATPKS
jgi:hypothetical protein